MPIGKKDDSGGTVAPKKVTIGPTKTELINTAKAGPKKIADEPKPAVNDVKKDPKSNLTQKVPLKDTKAPAKVPMKDTKINDKANDKANDKPKPVAVKAATPAKVELKPTPKTKAEPPKPAAKESEDEKGNIFGVNLKSVPNNKVKVPIFDGSDFDSDEYTEEEVTDEETEEEEETESEEESEEEKTPVRTTFRPPWVKEDKNAAKPPTKAWQLTKKGSVDKMKKKNDDEEEPHVPAFQSK